MWSTRILTSKILKIFLNSYASLHQLAAHSLPETIVQPNMKVKIFPALQDNYMYLIIDNLTRQAAAVDPVEPEKIVDTIIEEELNFTTILTTHYHWDHAGGNKKLCTLVRTMDPAGGDIRTKGPGGRAYWETLMKTINVYGGSKKVDNLTVEVGHDRHFMIGSLNIRCLFTPCHTSDHICYHVTSEKDPLGAVFSGDTLFVGGCGRFFEGTAADMHHALNDVLGTLPSETKVYCGHEYSISNLKYALHVEPDNLAVKAKLKWCQNRRNANLPTIPSTIGEEKTYNPFMRVSEKSVQRHTKTSDSIQTLEALRKEKDNFKA